MNQAGGYFTYLPSTLSGAKPKSGFAYAKPTNFRTVYSYRSGKGVPDAEDVVPTPSTEAGVFNYLHSLDEESGISDYAPWDKGHEFHSTVTGFNGSSWTKSYDLDHIRYYRGPTILADSAQGLPVLAAMPGSVPSSTYGARAIALTAPTNPNFALSEIVGQIVTGQEFPRLRISTLEERANHFRSLGDDYLNYEFGWQPFLNDVRSLARLAGSSSLATRQFLRDAMRRVRRGFQFPITNGISSLSGMRAIDYSLFNPVLYVPGPLQNMGACFTQSGNASAPATDITTTDVSVWFRGAFMYHVPSGKGTIGKLEYYEQRMNHLLGTEVTPSTLWELAPWTWLSDWITNFGDIIHNISLFGQDNLVLQYGYLMARSHAVRTVSVPGLGFGYKQNGSQNIMPFCYSSSYSIRKERVKATPYGFGLNPSSFTNLQWSILSALGLTKAFKTLPSL